MLTTDSQKDGKINADGRYRNQRKQFQMGENPKLSILKMYREQVTHCTGKTGKMEEKKFPIRGNTGNLESLRKHREFCLLKLKILFFFRSWIGLPIQFCVCNSHKSCKLAQGKYAVGQGKHREFKNTI